MPITRTIDHSEIRSWVEGHGGRPTSIPMSDGRLGVVRFTYDSHVHPWTSIEWEDFFVAFEDRKLAFVYEDEVPRGEEERLTRLVNRGAFQQLGEKDKFERIAS